MLQCTVLYYTGIVALSWGWALLLWHVQWTCPNGCAAPLCPVHPLPSLRSSYRLSPKLISVIGLGRTDIRNQRKAEGCRWLPGGGGNPVVGELKIHYAPENGWRPVSHPKPCRMQHPKGTP